MKKKIFVLSIDSLFDSDIPFCMTLPNFGRLFASGGRVAGGMRSTYPSLTYPAHASIITGTWPEKHGISHNEKMDVNDPSPEWFWQYESLKTETVIDCAHKAGCSTAVIGWPCMIGCPGADYLVPEIWARNDRINNRDLVLESSSANIRNTIIERHIHELRRNVQPYMDHFMVGCACDLIRQYQPDVTFMHIAHLDHTRHSAGLEGPAVEQALIANDEWLGRLMEAVEASGSWDCTDFIVLGDHGHLAVERMFNPNVLLAREGLITIGSSGAVSGWDAWCNSAGLSCQVVMKDPANTRLREKLESLLYGMVQNPDYGVESVFTARECRNEWHLTGSFEYVLESRNATSFGNACSGSVMMVPDNSDYKFSVAAHGHLPVKGAQPAFLVSGPSFREHSVTDRRRLIDIAPTVARILDISLPEAQGTAIEELLKP